MKRPIRMCIDRLLTEAQLKRAAKLAAEEDPSNVALGMDQSLASGVVMPRRIAYIHAKKWQTGRTLRVGWMGGTAAQRKAVRDAAPVWTKHANLKFEFDADPAKAEIRIAFRTDSGAWSYIGTDNLSVPRSQPTMNLGWLDGGVIEHEFGHAIGCIHEHQHPENGIPWNREAVYRYYGGYPNYWDRETIDANIFEKYSADVTQHSRYDPKSIMHYAIDKALLTDPSKATGWNKDLSPIDKTFTEGVYPGLVPPPPAELTIPTAGSYRAILVDGKPTLVLN